MPVAGQKKITKKFFVQGSHKQEKLLDKQRKLPFPSGCTGNLIGSIWRIDTQKY